MNFATQRKWTLESYASGDKDSAEEGRGREHADQYLEVYQNLVYSYLYNFILI